MCAALASAQAPANNLAAAQALIGQSNYAAAEKLLQAELQQHPQNAPALGLLGAVRQQQGNWTEAEKLYRQAVSSDPKSAEACSRLAGLLRDEYRWPEAVAQYETCRKLAPANTSLAADLAEAHQKAGNYRQSLSLLTAIPAAKRSSRWLPVLAADYLGLDDTAKLGETVSAIVQRSNADPTLTPKLCDVFLERGMVGDAAELLRVTEPATPGPDYLAALAKVQAAQGKVQDARRTFDQAVRLAPKSQSVLASGATLAMQWRQWDKALDFLDAAMAAGPPRSDLLQKVVFVELRKDDLQAAHDIAMQWHTQRPQETAGALAMAVVLVEGNHWGEAKPLLDQVLAKTPNDKGAQLTMGVVQYNAGDPAAAKKYLTAALGGGPDDANAHYFLALIAKQEGDPATAIRELKLSVAGRPDNPKAYGQLGQLYLQQGDLENARAALETAIEQAPDEPQNHYELARVYRKLNLSEQAEEQLKLYQKLRPKRPQAPPGETHAPNP